MPYQISWALVWGMVRPGVARNGRSILIHSVVCFSSRREDGFLRFFWLMRVAVCSLAWCLVIFALFFGRVLWCLGVLHIGAAVFSILCSCAVLDGWSLVECGH